MSKSEVIGKIGEMDPGLFQCCKGTTNGEYRAIERAIEVGCVTTALRNFHVGVLSENEMERFFELQRFFVELEARCFDDLGFE